MAKKPYLMIFLDEEALEMLSLLSDAERGRLLTAMCDYRLTGEPAKLQGNERVAWPVFRRMIDNAQAAYDKKVAAGAKGGKAKAESRKDTPKEDAESFISAAEAQEKQEAMNAVFDAAEEAGMGKTGRVRAALERLMDEYEPETLVEAIGKAALSDSRGGVSVNYLKSVLQTMGTKDEMTKALPELTPRVSGGTWTVGEV